MRHWNFFSRPRESPSSSRKEKTERYSSTVYTVSIASPGSSSGDWEQTQLVASPGRSAKKNDGRLPTSRFFLPHPRWTSVSTSKETPKLAKTLISLLSKPRGKISFGNDLDV